MNLTELLDITATRWPKKPALIEGATVVSYAELVEKTNALASQLETILSPGSRVGLYCPNSIAYVAMTFALWRVNAVVVPIPTECTEEELSTLAAAMQLEAVISPQPREASVPLPGKCF